MPGAKDRLMKKIIYRVLLTVFILAFAISGFFIGRQVLATRKAKSGFNDVTTMMYDRINAAEAGLLDMSAGLDSGGGIQDSAGGAGQGAAVDSFDNTRIIAYNKLHEEYPDFVGWIRVPGTVIDYPVMHTPSYPEFYLSRDFNKEKSSHGTPFLDLKCDIQRPSDNMIIYAHHMKDGTMFASLEKYKDKEFYETYKIIEFDTLYDIGQYEIMAVFLGSGNISSPGAFAYNQYINFDDESRFDEFFDKVTERRLYDTGIVPQFGDKFLTLSTCEYSGVNSRMVVVAREIRN